MPAHNIFAPIDFPMIPDWMTWSPFQSPKTKEICAHMTQAERRRIAGMGALFGFVFSITAQVPTLLQVAGLIPSSLAMVLSGLIVVAMFASIPRIQRWSRRILCNTEWARAQGYQPEDLALYEFRFGMKHLLVLMTIVAIVAAVVGVIRAH